MEEEIKEVSAFWGIEKIKSITKEYKFIKNANEKNVWSINERYMLKRTSEENEMRINVIMACLLAREQIPAQKLIPLKNGELYIYHKGYYYGLFTKIKGELVDDYLEGDYLNRAYYMGSNIGWLHCGLNNITDELSYSKILVDYKTSSNINEYVRPLINVLIEKKIITNESGESFRFLLNDIEGRRDSQYKSLTKHLIHKNLSNESVLFFNNRLSGYLDFELVEINLRIVDICRLSVAILEKAFYDDEKKEKWIKFHKELVIGYSTKVKLSEKENQCIKYLCYEILTHRIEKYAKKGIIKPVVKYIDMLNWIYSIGCKDLL